MVRSCDSLSPDPLGLTKENLETMPPLMQYPKKSGPKPKKPLTSTSNNVGVQELYLTTPPSERTGIASPFKLVAEAENPATPWRLRVTVEAEQENTQHSQPSRDRSPVKNIAERMTTIMVPLKDADEPSPAKKGRGRPRKSIDSPGNKVGTLKAKTSRTPKQKAAGSRQTAPASTKNPSNETGRRTPTPYKRGRGRPRKSTEGLAEDLASQDGEGNGLVDVLGVDHPTNLKATGSTLGGPSQEISPVKSALPVDSTGLDGEGVHDEVQLDLDSSAKTDSHSGLDCLSNLPDPTDEHGEFDSILESEGFSMVSVSSLPSARLHSSSPFEPKIDRDEHSSSLHDATLNPVSHLKSSATSPALGGENNREETDQAYLLNASPLPSSSIPQHFPEPEIKQTPSVTSPTMAIPPGVKSSVTRKPSRPLDKAGDGTPKLVRVVRAGIALQGVLSPQRSCIRSGNTIREATSSFLSTAKSPKERLDDLFGGFGAGTRRELRAGLRLGEELAKRHQIVPQTIERHESKDDVFGQDEMPSSSKLPGGIETVGYSLKVPEPCQKPLYPALSDYQLPTPARSEDDSDDDRMSWKVDTPNPIQTIDIKMEPKTREEGVNIRVGSDFEGSTIAREEEEYRLEREAVVRKIQAANSSQVIVINSDSEDEYEDKEEDDIWQEQAFYSEPASAPVFDTPAVLLQNHDPRPRRSQLPSPWRRQIEVTSSSPISGNNSDSFWQPSRIVDNTDGCEKLPEGKKGQDLTSQHSPDTPNHEEFGVDLNDSTFEPESMLHVSPIKQIIQVTQKVSNTVRLETPNSSALGEDEYDETSERLSGEQLNQEQAQKYAHSPCQATQKSIRGGKTVEVSLSEQRETVSFVPHQRVQAPASTWLGYLVSFVPAWGEATAARPHRLPNGKSKLPRAGSLEGPLSRYMPWTTGHYNALYFHYAASKEGRHRYVFNPKSESARYLGRIVRYRGWEKPVTKEDVAIVDAFTVDLKAREGSESGNAAGDWQIDEEIAVFKVFTLWHGGVQRGECEVGIGKTGLATDSDDMWRPDMESWYYRKRNEG